MGQTVLAITHLQNCHGVADAGVGAGGGFDVASLVRSERGARGGEGRYSSLSRVE